jgi:hypothetical protein
MEKLKSTKHEYGSLEKWIMRFKDQLDIYDALQCNVSDTFIFYGESEPKNLRTDSDRVAKYTDQSVVPKNL